MQPIVVSYAFSVISCKEFENNKFYIKNYLVTECYTADHYTYVKSLNKNLKKYNLDLFICDTIFGYLVPLNTYIIYALYKEKYG